MHLGFIKICLIIGGLLLGNGSIHGIVNQGFQLAQLPVPVSDLCQHDSEGKADARPIPGTSRQLLVVVSDSIGDPAAMLLRFERELTESPWKQVGKAVRVNLGSNGLGLGLGLHDSACCAMPQKVEGDGRSPAGVFDLGTAFGFNDKPDWLNWPFFRILPGHHGVDDIQSEYYNRIVLADTIAEPDWNSSEHLIDYPVVYAMGLNILHNSRPILAGRGSQIFMHIWRGPGKPTAGCTAMTAADLADVLQWLDQSQRPVLVQFPLPIYLKLQVQWGLPRLNHTEMNHIP